MRQPNFYLVIDLEATCGGPPREESEIIEIGAVLVNATTLETVDELQTFVRPVLHPTLSEFCTQLTTITQGQVDAAPRFTEAIDKLREFVRDRDVLFCSWGDYDRNQFARDARRHGVELPLGTDHWNLKKAFQQAAGDAKRLGNGWALARVGLRPEGTAHRGIDDARNIARLLPWILGRRSIPR